MDFRTIVLKGAQLGDDLIDVRRAFELPDGRGWIRLAHLEDL